VGPLWVGVPVSDGQPCAMTTSARVTAPRPSSAPPKLRASRYATQVSGLLLAAFGLSALYTVWTTATGVADDGFTATMPGVWAFYAAMIAVAILIRSDRTLVWVLLAGLLPLLLAVGIFVYPHAFTAEQQTTLGWFENDTYLGLLMVATYLTVQRLRRRSLTP
jgi:hypothetical protein